MSAQLDAIYMSAPRPNDTGADGYDTVTELMELLDRRLAVYTTLRHTAHAASTTLSPGDLRALDIVAELGPMTTGQLTRLSGLSAGNVTAIVDRLEQAGRIRREKDPQDRRIVRLSACTERTVQHAAREILEEAGEFKLAQMHALLTRYLESLREEFRVDR